ncbi:hypothetical protein CGRA01v4_07798 [Colletotrichum graminicola]|uniref:Uncharacterized protein n=1 Tax=Colletotrichum graminicola (strain M1.001 / M2 / FGSC 10212) TaxID=645133 RepID=E3QPT9_COLGM|nr:uncharacterized protein GLRG_08010 [Colletotrichum graminicola M1.001]EFQ32866.1 hypothetical protein GLRG_08010 [Colletotrichum graminicola M1.001]WDK16515.1 hypothetical protein CGRA01v4_07798 [Colletotrichum graminicola]
MTQPYIVGDSSPFLKRVLIPFWVIRIAIMLFYIIIYSAAAAYASANKNALFDGGSTSTTVIAVLVVILVIVVCCLILDIICIVKRSRRTLSPRFFLISNVIQTTVWLVLLILAVVGIRSPLGFIIAIVVFASFLGLLIYSSIVYHKYKKGYAPANHANQPSAYTGAYTANEPTKPSDANAPRYEMDNRYA